MNLFSSSDRKSLRELLRLNYEAIQAGYEARRKYGKEAIRKAFELHLRVAQEAEALGLHVLATFHTDRAEEWQRNFGSETPIGYDVE